MKKLAGAGIGGSGAPRGGGGSRHRERLFLGLADSLSLPEHPLTLSLSLLSTFHSSSLVIDDIVDESEVRRGAPAAWRSLGIAPAMTGAYLAVLDAVLTTAGNFRSWREETRLLLVAALVDAHAGQAEELDWRPDGTDAPLRCPPSDERLRVVATRKTGVAFLLMADVIEMHLRPWWAEWLPIPAASWTPAHLRDTGPAGTGVRVALGSLLVRLLDALSPLTGSLTRTAWVDLRNLLGDLGVFFQRRDDYVNVASPEYWASHGFCDDLHERKMTWLVAHAVTSERGRETLGALWTAPAPSLSLVKDVHRFFQAQGILTWAAASLRADHADLTRRALPFPPISAALARLSIPQPYLDDCSDWKSS
jgi:geranylgeranyl pyrophosphate synthase